MGRRLTCVVAGAGFGKTTLVSAWAARVGAVYYGATPEDGAWPVFARGLARELAGRAPGIRSAFLTGLGQSGPEADAERELRPEAWSAVAVEALDSLSEDLALVIDDAHELGRGSSAHVLETLCLQASPKLHLVVASRSDLPFPLHRMRGRGQVLELGGRDLAFSVDELADLLAAWIDPEAADLAEDLFQATGGWPAAVRLSAEALWTRPPDRRREALEALPAQEGGVFTFLAAEALASEPPEVTELLRVASRLDLFTAATCEALGVARARQTVASLMRRGLFLEPHARKGWLTLGPLAREFARERLPMAEPEERRLHRRAGDWFEKAGCPEEVLRHLAGSGDDEALAGALVRHGPELALTARVDAVLRAVQQLPSRDAALEVVVGQALQVNGDWEGALTCFRRAAEGQAALPAGLAWRFGLIHYLRGEVKEAQAVYERARLDGREPCDEALVLAWMASVHFLKGEREQCEAIASRALELASRTGDAQGLAAAHTVLAMLAALVGDRAANRAHDQRALDHATRAGDVLQMIRIRANRGSHAMEEGCYREALVEYEAGLRLTEVSGFAALRAFILCNRGQTRFHLGRLDEAMADLHEARLVYERMGSRRICLPLTILGDVRRERGEPMAARACYEEALAMVERSPDYQIGVPALAGLAHLLAEEDAEEASRLVDKALGCGPGPAHLVAVLASGHVALAGGHRQKADGIAAEAGAQARAQRNRAAMAEALELEAAAAGGERAVARLEAAIQLWKDLDSPVGRARAELSLAALLGDERGHALAIRARSCLRSLGAGRYERMADELLAALDQATVPPVAVQTLGGFRVFRSGVLVPLTAWQSRKARDLLKILIARRGRPVAREVLMDLLWPDEDPAAVSNRLSGALATLRAVLDPGHRFANDHFVASDKESMWLERSTVRVDVERFLSDAAEGLRHPSPSPNEASARLAAAEAAYGGEFLEEDPYEDWATPLRDEARAAYLALARSLASEALERHDHEGATRYFLRILTRDPYDEPAHQGLITTHTRAGRHGEAARARRTYRARMRELGIEPTPDAFDPRVHRAPVASHRSRTATPPLARIGSSSA